MVEEMGKVEGSFAEPHPEYKEAYWNWYAIRTAIKGEASIKRHNEMFLPMPAGMLNNPAAPSVQRSQSSSFGTNNTYIPYTDNPNYHTNAAYAAYKSRARYPELVGYTVRGLTGIATRNPPSYELPSSIEYIEDSATKEDISLNDFYNELIEQVLSVGRYIIVTDIDEEEDKPKFVAYPAESLINWKSDNSKKHEPYLLVFKVSAYSDDDVYNHESRVIYRVLSLEPDYNGYDTYTVTELEEDGTVISKVQPSYRGKTLDYIPVSVAGSNNNLLDVDVQPMNSISNIAQQLYMLSADLRNSEYMSCNPTLILSGVDREEAPKALGSTVALVLENPDAKAYFTETDTSALNHVLTHTDKLYHEAAIHGTQLLGPSSNVVEAASALKIRQSAASATLSSIVGTAGTAIQRSLEFVADWMDDNPDEVEFRPNKDFVELSLSSSELTAIVNAWQRGALSGESMLNNFKKSGLLIEDDEIEKEMKRLEEAGLPPQVAMQQIMSGLAEGVTTSGVDSYTPWGDTKMSRVLDNDDLSVDPGLPNAEDEDAALADRDRPR